MDHPVDGSVKWDKSPRNPFSARQAATIGYDAAAFAGADWLKPAADPGPYEWDVSFIKGGRSLKVSVISWSEEGARTKVEENEGPNARVMSVKRAAKRA